jgi:hypothetical protein
MSFQSVFPAIARVAAQSDGPGGLLIGAIKSRLNKTREPPRDYGALPQVPKGSSLSFSSGLKQLPAAAARLLGEKCQVIQLMLLYTSPQTIILYCYMCVLIPTQTASISSSRLLGEKCQVYIGGVGGGLSARATR